MSYQRRRGQRVTLYPQKKVVDRRGNEQYAPDLDRPIHTRAAGIPQRSSRAEVPGQLEVNVVRLIVKANLEGVTLWGQVEWDGSTWDIAAPPAKRAGTRHVRHWSIDIRERPNG